MSSTEKHKTNPVLFLSWLLGYFILGLSFTLLPILTNGPLIILPIGIASLGIFFWMIFKLYRVEVNTDGLILKNLTSKVMLSWSEILAYEAVVKFPLAKIMHYKIITKTGNSYRFPLDRQLKRVVGFSLEDTTPMERFFLEMIESTDKEN